MTAYESTFDYKLIYIMSIDDEDHRGLLKIGEATLSSTLGPSQLEPCCDELNGAARRRIDDYTRTALTSYELLHTELALRYTRMADGTMMPNPFSDRDIHDVLARSGYDCRKFPDTDRDTEWYRVDLDTAKRAIKAFKEGQDRLITRRKPAVPERKIVLRQEQEEAVRQTLEAFKSSGDMLWDCKMRFGKTLTAYELIRRAGYAKTIVVTHRPVVVDGWRKDHGLIFPQESRHQFLTKENGKGAYEYDAAMDSENERMLRNYSRSGIPFTYFASLQDLRGSRLAGGGYDKNRAVFSMDWDLIIYDEAHEGTQTELGEEVRRLLQEPKNGKKPKVLALSGTPYNIKDEYPEHTYSWDYVMEQRRKKEYAERHPDEHNPYADLPELRILTFDLQEALEHSYRFETKSVAFSFNEFFRVWTGDPEEDYRKIPEGKSAGDFVYEDDIRSFLDLITEEDGESGFPFSTEERRGMFRHTFWMVPGVKAARALSRLLKRHPVFSGYGIANVAGEGDAEEAYDDALAKVRKAIAAYERTITISCGRLTTGVTVPEWSAVLMLTGSSSTSASGYMQTIFRVQSAGSVGGRQKQVAYVFDFAPDRALSVFNEVYQSKEVSKGEGEGSAGLGELLNFCPVIAMSGTRMTEYDVPRMMRQIKKLSIEKAISSGFDDESIYKDSTGIKMDSEDRELLNRLAEIVEGQSRKKLKKSVTINENGLTGEEYRKTEKARRKPKKELTEEEKRLLEERKKQLANRGKAIKLLRSVSIRLPLLIYGARKDLTEGITLTDFTDIVDDGSWKEFMPKGVTKALFKELIKYYDEDVVVGAGLRMRRLARAADDMMPTQRMRRITDIFSTFRNPDKETVLTPWRVVNMHMGDIIGGWSFLDEGRTETLDEPRFIDRGRVTREVFSKNARILEMNSKSGLYPLYLTYSLYRTRLTKPETGMTLEEAQGVWREAMDQVFVLCKTGMAWSITRRTLAGYNDRWTVNAIYITNLLDRMKDKAKLASYLADPGTWGKAGKRMKFDAIVGNPPYQIDDQGNRNSSSPVYHYFVEQAVVLEPGYVSMITPSRWFAGGKGLDEFRAKILSDERMEIIVDYPDSKACFNGVDIAGGINYFLWNKSHSGLCQVTSIRGGSKVTMDRKLNEYDIFIRNNGSVQLLQRLIKSADKKMNEVVGARNTFGILTDEHGQPEKDNDHPVMLACSQKSNQLMLSYIEESKILQGHELINKYKVVIGRSVPRNGEVGVDPSVGYRAITTVHIFGPNIVFTDTYLLLSSFDNLEEAENFAKYMTLKFPRFLLHETYTSQSISMENFKFVPYLVYTREWTDKELFEKYNCNEQEIQMIVSMMRPLEYVIHDKGHDNKKSIYGCI